MDDLIKKLRETADTLELTFTSKTVEPQTEWVKIEGVDHDPRYEQVVKVEPTCQVRNDDTGELKTMTREKAKLLQTETKESCYWYNPSGYCCVNDFCQTGIYTYKLKAKPLKQVSWKDVPAGVMTNKQYFIIEKSQVHEVIEHLETGFDDDSDAMTVLMLQSLPMVDSEPVAWRTQSGDLVNPPLNLKTDALMYGWQPLYTSPQALTDREIAEKCAEICSSRSRSISADGHNVMAANEASKCALAIEHHWQTYPSKAPTPITAGDINEK